MRWRWPIVLGLAAVLVAACELDAQQTQPTPHIGYVYPAGGRQGTTFEVLVGGQYLKDVTAAYISGSEVQVTLGKYHRPLTQGEFNQLRMKLEEARIRLEEERKKSGSGAKPGRLLPAGIAKAADVTDAQLEAMEEYRKRQADPKRQLNPQISEEISLQVTISTRALAGDRELRLITPSGMSNPLYFYVGPLPECRETEPNDQKADQAIGDSMPVVINGQIMPGDIDRHRFTARRGARLVIAASAREVIPYLADAVPGWFQAVLALYDASGSEVAYANAFGYRQDPMIYYEVPKDGAYTVEIRDALYRGREDFVYRIAMGEVPFVTSIFPLGGRAGTHVDLELAGWNLPVNSLRVEAIYDRGRPMRPISVSQQAKFSNRVVFAVDSLTECLEQEPNDGKEAVQTVALPMIVNGRIDPARDRDVFRFEGHAGDKLVAEVRARRLGTPVDSLLVLSDAAGREVAVNDDYEDKSAALTTHHADSRIAVTLPASGTYYLRLTDAQSHGGPEYAYRLHIRPPRPDFDLRVVPSSIIARTGTSVPITVYALRKDGLSDDIFLGLVKPPTGFWLSGAWVPANQDKVRLTLTVPPNSTAEPLSLDLEGRAVTRGYKESHFAVPAEAMMQAFAYHHLVPAKDWTVMVTGRAGAKPAVQLLWEERIRLTPGGTARLLAKLTGKQSGSLVFELSEPPDGVTIEKVLPESGGAAILLRADAAKVKPGLKGNLIFNAFLERSVSSSDGKPQTSKQRSPLGMLPAVPFEVGEP